jgi:nucleotide-binding universal stress UspA family protein
MPDRNGRRPPAASYNEVFIPMGLDQIKKILCPYDFTPACRTSLRESVILAKKLGAALEIVHVLISPPIVVLTPGESLPAPPIDQEDFLKTVEARRTPEIRAELERAGAQGVPVEIAFEEGMHADLAILERAEEVHADLIVMAKHARAAISRFLIGSTTERVLRHARCSVLVIPAAEAKRP